MSARSAASAPVDRVIRAAAAVSRVLVEAQGLRSVLEHVAHLSQRAVPQSEAAGCTLLRDGRPALAGFTAECVARIEKPWYESSSGPGPVAIKGGHVVTTMDLYGEYGTLRDQPAGFGRTSVMAVPLRSQEQTVSVVTLYSQADDAFAGFHRDQLEPFLAQAAVTIRNAQAYAAATERAEQFEEALASRAVIEQAKGAIMARRRVSADEAFALLRQSSQRRNVKLREVAFEVVESTSSGR
jgi:GAF domain-containing protein